MGHKILSEAKDDTGWLIRLSWPEKLMVKEVGIIEKLCVKPIVHVYKRCLNRVK
jgi:hypothetical protein